MISSEEQLNPKLQDALRQLVHAQDFYDLCVIEPESRETGALRDAKVQLREAAYDVVAILRGEQ